MSIEIFAAAVISEDEAQTFRELLDENKPLLKDTGDLNGQKSVSRYPACGARAELELWAKWVRG